MYHGRVEFGVVVERRLCTYLESGKREGITKALDTVDAERQLSDDGNPQNVHTWSFWPYLSSAQTVMIR